MSRTSSSIIVIPCFNEERRLDPRGTRAPLRVQGAGVALRRRRLNGPRHRLVLNTIAARHSRAEVFALEHNVGKGEAVRMGMLSPRLPMALRLSGTTTLKYRDAPRRDAPPPRSRRIRAGHRGGDRCPRRPARSPHHPFSRTSLPWPRLRHRGFDGPGPGRLRHAVRRQGIPSHTGTQGSVAPTVPFALGRSTWSCSTGSSRPMSARSRARPTA